MCYNIKGMKNDIKSLLIRGLREAATIYKTVDPLLGNAGFNVNDMESVEEEYNVRTSFGIVEIDKCLKSNGKALAFLQAKPLGKSHLFKIDYQKTFEAASRYGVPYAIFTSGDCWEFYKQTILRLRVNLLYKPQKSLEVITFLKEMLAERRAIHV